MIVGVGVDVVDLARFEEKLAGTPALLERLFHPNERAYSAEKLAGCFAAKEAVVKAIGGPSGLSWVELSVVRDTQGRPWINAEGETAQTFIDAGISKLHLSISHDGGMLTAFVVAEGVGALIDGEGGWNA